MAHTGKALKEGAREVFAVFATARDVDVAVALILVAEAALDLLLELLAQAHDKAPDVIGEVLVREIKLAEVAREEHLKQQLKNCLNLLHRRQKATIDVLPAAIRSVAEKQRVHRGAKVAATL